MTITGEFSRKGAYMKRATLIAVLALTILFAMSASAFAYVNTPGTADPDGASNFLEWGDVSANPANSNGTPHVGFSTTSQKCAVCHSVHNADASGDTQNILLRSTRAGACVYCHVTGSVSSNKPYGSELTSYTVDVVFNHSDDPGPGVLSTYAGCTSCHSVHGANTYTDSDVATAILRDTSGADTDVPAGYATGTKPEVLTAFCSQCHPYYASYDTSTTEGNHIMTTTISNYNNPDADSSISGVNEAVAAVGSGTCQACHDATGATSGDSFPHYMPDNARFLAAAPFAGGGIADVADPSIDGACIKCHLWTGGTEGVGEDF